MAKYAVLDEARGKDPREAEMIKWKVRAFAVNLLDFKKKTLQNFAIFNSCECGMARLYPGPEMLSTGASWLHKAFPQKRCNGTCSLGKKFF